MKTWIETKAPVRRALSASLLVVVAGSTAACGGPTCEVKDVVTTFESCEDIQARYAEEQSRPEGADLRVLRDLDTCAAINGCEEKP